MSHHPIRRKYKVTILRQDGTAWVIEHAKHVLFKTSYIIEVYLGEHNVDRRMLLIPLAHIDHLYLEEENEENK